MVTVELRKYCYWAFEVANFLKLLGGSVSSCDWLPYNEFIEISCNMDTIAVAVIATAAIVFCFFLTVIFGNIKTYESFNLARPSEQRQNITTRRLVCL